jgi:transcriptional regulator with XRE-family HTH domain
MGQINKNVKNEFFKVAIDYIYKEHLVSSQGELAEKIGISTSALSRIMNNKKCVGDDTLRKMNEAFGGIFNMAYFRGESVVLLVEDVAYYKSHPGELNKIFNGNDNTNIDQSSLVNATLAAKDETIASLKKQISDKDKQLTRYENDLDTKDETIKMLQARVRELEAEISIIRNGDPLKGYPFVIGAAEGIDRPKPEL